MDNVLVNREKWNELLDYVDRQLTYANEMSVGINQAKNIKLMPDFVESEEDVEVVAVAINEAYALRRRDEPMVGGKDTYLSQAAINALKPKEASNG